MPPLRKANDDAIRFGAIIRRLREERGWSIAQMARKLRMNPTHLGVLERGGNIPSLATILSLGDGLGISGADLVREVEESRREAARRRSEGRRAAAAAARGTAGGEPDQ